MSFLLDLILDGVSELIVGGVGPETDRGIVATFSIGSFGLLSVAVWLIATEAAPLRQPAWGLMVFASAIFVGVGGLIVSTLHLRRNDSDRLFGFLCLSINVAAVAIPGVWILAR